VHGAKLGVLPIRDDDIIPGYLYTFAMQRYEIWGIRCNEGFIIADNLSILRFLRSRDESE